MQIFLNGIISGASIALLALAFQMVYLPTNVFFIGLAGIFSLAPFVAYASTLAGASLGVGVALAILAGMGISLACEWLNHAPLARRRASDGVHLISSLGIYIILVQGIAILWGNQSKSLRTGLDITTHWGGTVLTGPQLVMAGVAALLLLVVWVMLRASGLGLRLRALADSPRQFALFGYNVNAYRLISFALGGAFASVSSLLTAYDISFDPYTGLHAVLLAVVAVIIGGRRSFFGPVTAGLLLGLLRAEVVWHFSARWQEAVTFGTLALFLLFRPYGLFGQKSRVEATAS